MKTQSFKNANSLSIYGFLLILNGSVVYNVLAKIHLRTKIILNYRNIVKISEAINIGFYHFFSFSPHCLPLTYNCTIQQNVCCSPSQLFIFLFIPSLCKNCAINVKIIEQFPHPTFFLIMLY